MPDNKTVFLFDVDNTLLDNDHVTADLKRHLESHGGLDRSQRYWQRFEEIRTELGYADYLGALQRYRFDYPHDPNLLTVSYFLMGYPFANRLFPNSLDAVEHVGQWGQPVILSDGDVVFQFLIHYQPCFHRMMLTRPWARRPSLSSRQRFSLIRKVPSPGTRRYLLLPKYVSVTPSLVR